MALRRSAGTEVFKEHGRWNVNWVHRSGWYEPLNRLPFTPLLSCEPGLIPGESVLMSRFDWHFVTERGWAPAAVEAKAKKLACSVLDGRPLRLVARGADPRTVWAAPHLARELVEVAARSFDPGRADRLVVFSANELPLSAAFGSTDAERNRTLAALRRYFGRIVYQNQDMHIDGVHVAPMGLSWGYMTTFLIDGNKAEGRSASEMLEHFGEILLIGFSAKSRNILASWGKVASHLDAKDFMVRYLHRLRGQGRLFPDSNASIEACLKSVETRQNLRDWAGSAAGRAAGVELRRVRYLEWWMELPKYRFLLCPIGAAVQTAKVIEALLVLTVPIVDPMGFPVYGMLTNLGFPIVLVGSWAEVTLNKTEAWWREMSPRLESFRRNCLTVDAYWGMYTGAIRRCE